MGCLVVISNKHGRTIICQQNKKFPPGSTTLILSTPINTLSSYNYL